ncbi:hypothetical protein BpHYR1_028212 [Brachionus plicatilis]|uniref:Uncharacterized protein n=1 Tax=Brachionus plicatilis TaxID=10195 RepID=A0A3M7QZY8_BRAPC|nr:hypothetical protein BpHYR1_028212 [Brachionus plicatilis]
MYLETLFYTPFLVNACRWLHILEIIFAARYFSTIPDLTGSMVFITIVKLINVSFNLGPNS